MKWSVLYKYKIMKCSLWIRDNEMFPFLWIQYNEMFCSSWIQDNEMFCSLWIWDNEIKVHNPSNPLFNN